LLKNSADHEAGAVAAVCDRRNSTACKEATLTERRYSEFFSNMLVSFYFTVSKTYQGSGGIYV